ncbi:helix-turn-helix domain-containing protein [Micromonosporaceae bacterium B7E4]
MSSPTKRRYSSPLRREQAAATRLRIAEAARELMLEHGYQATTLVDVAQRAGVAVQTLYATCPGGKPALAKLVWDITVAGDAQPMPQSARPEVQAIVAEPDPVRKVERFAAMATAIQRRTAPLHRVLRAAAAAAAPDSDVPDVLAATERERLVGSRGPAEDLAAAGALRAGLSVERAAHQVYVLTSVELFDRLTGVCGWDPTEYRDWLARQLRAALLHP